MTDTVQRVLDTHIDQMFVDLVEEYDLPFGDIEPGQAFQLDELKERLGELLGDFVHQNLPEVEDEEV